MRDTCYMCEAPALTKEHAPPQSFFPKGFRRNLITVPSCADHNTKNSMDVEYVRNVISTQHGTNAVATSAFETVKRSFEHSPALMRRTFRNLTPLRVEDGETGAFRIDLKRHRKVMKAIAYALYFHDNGTKHVGDWQIFTSSFLFADSAYDGRPDPWEGLRRYLESGKFTEMRAPQPEVFKYGVIRTEEGETIYRFEFYGSFVVNAWTRPLKLSPYIFLPAGCSAAGTVWMRSED
jgi:hypothetical protein